MKQFILYTLAFIGVSLNAQTVLFQEDFDGTLNIQTDTSGVLDDFKLDSTLSVSGNSFHIVGDMDSLAQQSEGVSSIVFDVNRATQNEELLVSFYHILYTEEHKSFTVEYSTNGGNTWSNYFVDRITAVASNLISNKGGYKSFDQNNIYPNWYSYEKAKTPLKEQFIREEFRIDDWALGNTTGTIKIRLNLIDTNISATPSHEGWYIDNIKVSSHPKNTIYQKPHIDAASCDMGALKPHIYYRGSFNYYNYEVEMNTQNINSVVLMESKNGGPFVANTMSGSNSIYNLTKSYLNDTVKFYFKITGQTGLTHFLPDTLVKPYYQQIHHQTPAPTKCLAECFSDPLEKFKGYVWRESFDSSNVTPATGSGNIGDASFFRGYFATTNLAWLNVPSESVADMGWSLRSIETATEGTGPSASKSGDKNYMYVEGSHANTINEYTYLISPCILIPDSNYQFSFYNHLFGKDLGRFRVDIDSGAVNNVYANNAYKLNGQVETSSNESWRKVTMDMAPYAGKIVRFRFRYVTDMAGDKQDAAIDELSLSPKSHFDIGIGKIHGNYLNQKCYASQNQDIQVSVINHSSVTLDSVTLNYSINGGATVSEKFALTNFNFLDTAFLTFSQQAVFSNSQLNKVDVWIDGIHDSDSYNNHFYKEIPPLGAQNISLPHYAHFNNSQRFDAQNELGLLNETNWYLNYSDKNLQWRVNNTSGKVSGNPLLGINGNNYLDITEDTAAIAGNAELVSSCIDLTGKSDVYFGMYQLNVAERATVQVILEDGTRQNVNRQNSFSLLASDNKLIYEYYDLGAYSNQNIKIAVIGTSKGAVLGGLEVFEAGNAQMSIDPIITPQLSHTLGRTLNIQFNLRFNPYNDNLSNANFEVYLTDTCTPTNSYSLIGLAPTVLGLGWYSPSLSFDSISFPNLQAGVYRGVIKGSYPGDSLTFNDSIQFLLNVLEPAYQIPYANDFNQCAKGFYSGPSTGDWGISLSSKPGFASPDGSASMHTRYLETDSTITEILYAPTFVGFNSLKAAQLHFSHNYDLGNGKATVEYFNYNTQKWSQLPYILFSTNYSVSYTGSSNGWQDVVYPLDNYSDDSLKLRFVVNYSNLGWAIDNFEIVVPEQYSISPQILDLKQANLPTIGTTRDFVTIVKNTGQRAISSFDITVDHNGNTNTSNISLSTPIATGKTARVSIPNSFTLAQQNEFVVITSLPNNLQDELPEDDTLRYSLFIPEKVDSLDFCTDLEINQGLGHYFNGGAWEFGTPAKNQLNAAYSGVNSWSTKLDTSYPKSTQDFLYSAYFNLDTANCYELSFYLNHKSELNFDGLNLQYSTDSGQSWNVLGAYNQSDSNWYNTEYVQSLGSYEPGWSGNSNGWKKVMHSFKPSTNGKTAFRFQFASNASVQDEGFSIDDFCVKLLKPDCSPQIGVADFNEIISSIYPNPFKNELVLTFTKQSEHQLIISDINGRTVLSTILNEEYNTVNTATLAKGVYLISLVNKTSGQVYHQKIIKD